MGPTIFKIQKPETKYSLRLFPIGGFVSMEGEDEESSDERAFCKKPVYKRIAVVVAGAFMNLLLGFIILVIVVSCQSQIGSMEISSFREGATSNAANGLQVGDVIKKVDGLTIYDSTDLQYSFAQDSDMVFDVTVKRNGERVTLNDVKFSYVTFTASDGVTYKAIDFVRKEISKNPITVVKQAFGRSVSYARLVWISLCDLVKGKADVKDVSGPIGVATAVNQAQSVGVMSVLVLSALITINIGIFNLLPLPALDGGRLVFLLIEAIIRKRVPQKYEAIVHAIGLACFMVLTVIIAFNDVFRIIK